MSWLRHGFFIAIGMFVLTGVLMWITKTDHPARDVANERNDTRPVMKR